MQKQKILIDLLTKFGPIVVAIILMFIVTRVHADYEQGLDAAFSGDYQTAFREFSAAAEAGLDLAQYNLAILYFTGQGVAQDFEQAFKWTELAALQGHLGAQANLASLYLEGSGTAKDIASGIEWFSVAARGGHPGAAFALANIYHEGDPTDQDEVFAHAYASLAVLNEHPDAEAFRNQLESQLDQNSLSQARRLFARWQIEPLPAPQRNH